MANVVPVTLPLLAPLKRSTTCDARLGRMSVLYLRNACHDFEGYGGFVANAVLIANFAATWAMVGLIWFVQNVHYPLLARVGLDRAREIAVIHQRRTAQIVALPMAIEGLSTLGLLFERPDGVAWVLPWVGGITLAVAMGCTVLLSVPLHEQMANDPRIDTGKRLVQTNWPRTVAWTSHGVVALIMVVQAWA